MIIKRNEAMPARPVVVVIYGVPGCGKTSLAATAEMPLLIDCDRGSDRCVSRPDTLVCDRWEDVTAEYATMAAYKTVVIDTAKAALDDFLCDYAVRKDEASRKNKLKMYGFVGDEFKAFVAKLRAMGKDVVILAHAAEDKDGDERCYSPSCTGQSKDLIQRIADQIGFLSYAEDNGRVLHFCRNFRIVAKDVAMLGDVSIPDAGTEGFSTALADIISATKASIQRHANAQVDALDKVREAKDRTAEVTDAETATAAYEAIKASPAAARKELNQQLAIKTKSLALTFDKGSQKFVATEPMQ